MITFLQNKTPENVCGFNPVTGEIKVKVLWACEVNNKKPRWWEPKSLREINVWNGYRLWDHDFYEIT